MEVDCILIDPYRCIDGMGWNNIIIEEIMFEVAGCSFLYVLSMIKCVLLAKEIEGNQFLC